MMIDVALIVALALLHGARGREWISPLVFVPLASAAIIAFGWYQGIEGWKFWALFAVIPAGITQWCQWGVGPGFSAIHGRPPDRGNIKLVDKLADFMVPFPQTKADNRRWGTWWMTFRGLFGWCLFAALFFINPWAPLIGIGIALQGLIYAATRYIPEKYSVMVSEPVTAAWLGLLLTWTL